jgi:hypothetical protein
MSPNRWLVLEGLDQVRLGVVRGMDPEVGKIQKERVILVPSDKVDGFVRQEIGQIRTLWAPFP